MEGKHVDVVAAGQEPPFGCLYAPPANPSVVDPPSSKNHSAILRKQNLHRHVIISVHTYYGHNAKRPDTTTRLSIYLYNKKSMSCVHKQATQPAFIHLAMSRFHVNLLPPFQITGRFDFLNS